MVSGSIQLRGGAGFREKPAKGALPLSWPWANSHPEVFTEQ